MWQYSRTNSRISYIYSYVAIFANYFANHLQIYQCGNILEVLEVRYTYSYMAISLAICIIHAQWFGCIQKWEISWVCSWKDQFTAILAISFLNLPHQNSSILFLFIPSLGDPYCSDILSEHSKPTSGTSRLKLTECASDSMKTVFIHISSSCAPLIFHPGQEQGRLHTWKIFDHRQY